MNRFETLIEGFVFILKMVLYPIHGIGHISIEFNIWDNHERIGNVGLYILGCLIWGLCVWYIFSKFLP